MSSIPWQSLRFPRFPLLRRAVQERVRRWARDRQGGDTYITRLQSRRIYILPTGVGLVFALMTFAMLLGSMNYNNNLSFLLTFLLIGLGFVAMHQCQRNIVGLVVSFAGVEPVFSGQASQFRIAVTNHSKNPRYRIRLYLDSAVSDIHDLEPGRKPCVCHTACDRHARLGSTRAFRHSNAVSFRAVSLVGLAAYEYPRSRLSEAA